MGESRDMSEGSQPRYYTETSLKLRPLQNYGKMRYYSLNNQKCRI